MRFSQKQAISTVTTFAGLLYIVCAALFFVIPETALKLFGLMAHGIDLTKIAKTPAIGETVIGFFVTIIITAVLTAVFVVLWNKFDERGGY